MKRSVIKKLYGGKLGQLQNLVFALFVAIAVIVTYNYGYTADKSNNREVPIAKQGQLVLTNSDLEQNSLLQLTGEFFFYWNRLLTLEDLKTDSILTIADFAYVPSVWNNKNYYKSKVSPKGYATYHLLIKVPKDGMYGLKLKELDCAYKLMVNEETVKIGQVGTTKENTIPSWKRQEVFFYSKNKEINLVLQIANFHHRKGGPEDVILFGTAQKIKKHKIQQVAISVFLFGVLFILAVYFILIYIVGRRESSVIWFSVLCLFALFRLLSTGEKILLNVVPNLSWDVAIRIEYLSFVITSAMSFSFLRTFYKNIFKKWVEQLAWGIAILSSLGILFLSPLTFTYIPIYYQWVILFLGGHMFVSLLIALFKRFEFSVYFFVGITFFYASLINDILYFNKLINSGYLMPYGLFILFFSFSFVMSKHLTYAFLDAERLKSALERQTKHLERKVSERTNKIQRQKDSIQEQALNLEEANSKLLELNRFRDDMTGMIVHDLKNPLNSIINLVMMKDVPEKEKLIWQAGVEMHNMVLNILDVNKAGEVGLELNENILNFNDIVKDAVKDVSVNASKRGIAIRIIGEFGFKVMGDREILKRVLVNLLINAIRFSPTNSNIDILINTFEDDNILCAIKDQGPGISKDEQELIYDRYRSSGINSKALKSTGLGLTFCKMAVEAHGGSIFVNSDVGQGSEFCIKLPFESSALDSQQVYERENDHELISEISIESKTILQPYLKRMQCKEVFEVSDIVNIMDEIRNLYVVDGQLVINSIYEAVSACNQKRYDQIINSLIV